MFLTGFAEAEAFAIQLFADVIAVLIAIPPVIFVPVADHAAVSELDIIKVECADALICGAVAL
jgi:hypothetical protein